MVQKGLFSRSGKMRGLMGFYNNTEHNFDTARHKKTPLFFDAFFGFGQKAGRPKSLIKMTFLGF